MSLTALALWACGGDDEPEVPQPPVSSAIEVKYQSTLSDDLLKVAYMWNGTTVTTATIDWGFNAEGGNSTDTPVSGDPASGGAE